VTAGALATNPVAGKYLDAPADEKEEGPGEVDRPWGVQIQATHRTILHCTMACHFGAIVRRARGSSTFFENAAPQGEVRLVDCTGLSPRLSHQCRYLNSRMIKEQSQISHTIRL
jgi:hypothetical protein